MSWIDVTGKQSEFVNLAFVRRIQMKIYGDRLIALTFTYSDGEEDTYTIPVSRVSVLEERLCELVMP